MKIAKKSLCILSILFIQILYSQTIFKVDILKNHKYDIYSDENLQLILDKTNSTFFFTYLPSKTGESKQFSEGSFIISNRELILNSKLKSNYNPKLFKSLSFLKFKIRKRKIIPDLDPKYDLSDIYYFSKSLYRNKLFKEYPNLVYQEK